MRGYSVAGSAAAELWIGFLERTDYLDSAKHLVSKKHRLEKRNQFPCGNEYIFCSPTKLFDKLPYKSDIFFFWVVKICNTAGLCDSEFFIAAHLL